MLRWQGLSVMLVVWLMVACAPAADPPTPTLSGEVGGYLTVLEWTGFEEAGMWADFSEAHPDVIVDFMFGVSDEDIFAQTQARSGADVVHLYTPFLKFYVDEGLLREIDTSQLAYWDEIPTHFQEICTIDGKVYCVPWDWGLTSVVYRTDKIPEPVESWDALFNEEYAGHVAMWDSGYGAYEVGSYVLDYDISALTDTQIEDIQQLWLDQRAMEPFYWVSESDLVLAMTNGDTWISYGWNGGYYALLEAGVPVAFATPDEGRSSYVGLYGITAESDNPEAALAFIDLKLAEQSSTNLLTTLGYGHVNPKYYDTVTDPNLIEALSLDDPSALEDINFSAPFSYEALQTFVEMWDEVKAAP